MDTNQRMAMAVAAAICSAVDAGGEMGAPSGVLYAALMGKGCSLEKYQSIMAGLERAGAVIADGDCYRNTDIGKRLAALRVSP